VAALLRTQSFTPALSLGVAAALATTIVLVADRPAQPRGTGTATPGTTAAALTKPPPMYVQRSMAREVIAREVAAGRTPLAQAVALFARLNELSPRTALPLEPMIAEADKYGVAVGAESSAGEAVWLQTMLWVIRQADHDGVGKSADELARPLAAEYRAARAAGRLTQLPAVDEAEYQRLMAASEKLARQLTGSELPPGEIE
jgi:hypothetical protein